MLTNEEVICTFMEAKPSAARASLRGKSDLGWWRFVWISKTQPRAQPRDLTLDALHQVEARLVHEAQAGLIGDATEHGVSALHRLSIYNIEMRLLGTHVWHASAEQKIAALATVLRPVVEPPC